MKQSKRNLNQESQRPKECLKRISKEIVRTEETVIQGDPRKRLLLSDILNWRSTNHTEASEIGAGDSCGDHLEVANKQLRANLKQIFQGLPKAGDEKKKHEFKIGKSLEVPRIRKNSFVGHSSKESFNEPRVSKREGSLQLVEDKKSFHHQKPIGEEKKAHKPPLPKTSKPDNKFNQVFLSSGDLNGQTVKVRVDVQIVAGQKEIIPANYAKPKKNPPRPPQPNHPPLGQKKASLGETRLIKQHTSSQQSLGLPDIGSKNSFVSNQRSDKSELDNSRRTNDHCRMSLKNNNPNKRSDFIVKKMQTEQSSNMASDKMRNSGAHWKQAMRDLAKNYLVNHQQPLLEHEEFISSKGEKPKDQMKRAMIETENKNEYSYSHSQKSTPNLLLKEQEMEIFGSSQICMFKRRNSDACLSSNTKNKIKYFLSDNVTRVFFEKIYKEKNNLNLDSSIFN